MGVFESYYLERFDLEPDPFPSCHFRRWDQDYEEDGTSRRCGPFCGCEERNNPYGGGLSACEYCNAEPEPCAFRKPYVCEVCGCTDDDCSQCIEKTGEPCHWVEPDFCSACSRDVEEASEDDEDDEKEKDDGDIFELTEQCHVLDHAFSRFFMRLNDVAGSHRDRIASLEAFVEGLELLIPSLEKRIQRVADMLADHLAEHEKDGR